VLEAGIADVVNQLNNRLSAILSFAELARRTADDPAEREALERVGDETRRAATIVRDLLHLVRPPGPGEGVAPLAAVIEAVRHKRRASLEARGIVVEVDLPPALPLIAAGPGDLETLLLRLLAFSEARVREAPERLIRIGVHQLGAGVILTLTDTGPPLPAGHAEHDLHYFRPADPEFLGHVELALAQRVAESCGAGVRLETGPGGVAEVTVTLIPTTLLTPPLRHTPVPRAFTGGHVLVADDDEANRSAFGRLLQRSGHRATLAADGLEAIDALASGARPDVIVLDLQMPRIGGQEAYEQIAARWPALARRVVFVTAASGEFLRRTGQPVVRKPFEIEDFLAAVASVVPPPPPPPPPSAAAP
jgi:CheY-like chemotaxis protein